MAHYFDSSDTKSEEKAIKVQLLDTTYNFITDNSVFSKTELDEGSKLLIECVVKNEDYQNSKNNKCLDLGCGYGVVGIICNDKNTTNSFDYVDINTRAITLTNKNIRLNKLNGNAFTSNCLDDCKEFDYDYIISNPPIRAGNEILFKMFSQSFEHLKDNGKLVVVLRPKQGAKTYVKKIMEQGFRNENKLGSKKGFEVYEFTK